jgi:hypothetical protein
LELLEVIGNGTDGKPGPWQKILDAHYLIEETMEILDLPLYFKLDSKPVLAEMIGNISAVVPVNPPNLPSHKLQIRNNVNYEPEILITRTFYKRFGDFDRDYE